MCGPATAGGGRALDALGLAVALAEPLVAADGAAELDDFGGVAPAAHEVASAPASARNRARSICTVARLARRSRATKPTRAARAAACRTAQPDAAKCASSAPEIEP
jgi:hypothetical protein